ncbi:hypothetical protein H3Z83_11810 [Tenacibaculum sp. S7007]|uniref:SAM-dependent MTase RsmB/NOP-type domain-containing protein n=1 Tax=Tenacibaculum pelagium TaxID=2759527 RepID=A0A839ASE0_9FLAO|nr:hypothetical protein [Tenacibaculum pelagium]MBA6157199.1 hypothetical protein [Tenacibaculum pelagium]
MKLLLRFSILLLIISCTLNKFRNDELIGEWNTFYIINSDNVDLAKNYSQKSILTKPLSIRRNGFFLIQLIDSANTYLTGNIERIDSTKIKIINSNYSRLNGTYNVFIEKRLRKGSLTSYLELTSDQNLIIAERFEKRINPKWK